MKERRQEAIVQCVIALVSNNWQQYYWNALEIAKHEHCESHVSGRTKAQPSARLLSRGLYRTELKLTMKTTKVMMMRLE